MFLKLFLTLLALCLGRWLWRMCVLRWKYDLHKIPSPPSIPFIGQALQFVNGEELTIILGRFLKQLGHPKIMEMLGNDPSVKGFTLLPAVSPYVKAVRRLYAAAFSTSGLKSMFPKVQSVLGDMCQVVDDRYKDGPIDIQKLCVKMTLDTIGLVAFDSKLGGLDNSRDLYDALIEVGHYGRLVMLNLRNKLMCKFFPNCALAKRVKTNIDRLTRQWDVLTKEILDRPDPENLESVPLWYAMKTLIDPDTGKRLNVTDLRSELATIVVAGMDTTGHQLAWILSLLTSYPHMIDKLREELKGHGLIGTDGREITFEDLGELSYLTAIIKEGMRVAHSTVGTMMRIMPEDMTLLGYRLPKGTVVWIPSNRSLDSEADWDQPTVFRPERWLGDEDLSKKYYLGFSYGPRDCVGQKLAMMEMRLALIEMVKRYRFETDTHVDDLMRTAINGIAIEARDGMWMRISPRNHEDN